MKMEWSKDGTYVGRRDLYIEGELFGHVSQGNDTRWTCYHRNVTEDFTVSRDVGSRSNEKDAMAHLELVARGYGATASPTLPPGVQVEEQSITLTHADSPGRLVVSTIIGDDGPYAQIEAEKWQVNPGELELLVDLVNEMLERNR